MATDLKRQQHSNALAGYWSGIHAALDGRLVSVKDYLRHPSSGFNAENYFRDLLRQYLPRRYSVESGFVVNVAGERSDFMDVLIVDCLHIPPLSAESHFKIFPAEAVVGALEITSAPKAKVKRSGFEKKIGKLQDDILKLARLRKIAKEREYLFPVTMSTPSGVQVADKPLKYFLSPRCFLITCGDEWTKFETYERALLDALDDASKIQDEVWINSAFSMRHGMYHFTPHTQFNWKRIEENSLLEFIFFVNNAISEFRTSRIDLRRYRPTMPVEQANKPLKKRHARKVARAS